MRIILAAMAVTALGGCTTGPETPAAQAATVARADKYEADLAKALAGKSPGEPVSCINLRDVRSVKGVGDRTLLYTVSSRLIYRNDPPGGCRLRSSEALITKTPSNQLCRGEIARVADLSAGIESGSCGLGDFTPYRG